MNKYLVLNLNNEQDAWYFGNKFLNDRKTWDAEIKRLDKELESISEIQGIKNSEVHSGNIGNPTQNTAMLEISIMEKKEHIERYQQILLYGLSRLSEEDIDVINGFYYTKGRYISAIVDELSHKYFCDVRTIYRKKRTAVLNFVEAVRGIIG